MDKPAYFDTPELEQAAVYAEQINYLAAMLDESLGDDGHSRSVLNVIREKAIAIDAAISKARTLRKAA